MAHEEQQLFVKLLRFSRPGDFRGKRVLEVGSLNLNGSVRPFFEGGEYLGIDLGPGPGVDLVTHVCELPSCSGPFDTVISCEALEHDQRWKDSLRAMWAFLRPGGLLIVTCAARARPPHGTADAAPECSPFTLDHYQGIDDSDVRQVLAVELNFLSSDMDTRFWAVKPG